MLHSTHYISFIRPTDNGTCHPNIHAHLPENLTPFLPNVLLKSGLTSVVIYQITTAFERM